MVAQSDWKDRFVDSLTRVAGILGFNEVRVRWKLSNWMNRTGEGSRLTVNHARQAAYQHKICHRCGRIQDRSNRVCEACGDRLPGMAFQVLGRLGLRVPSFLSMTTLLTLLIVGVYLRVAFSGDPEASIAGFSGQTLLRFGADFAPALRAGEWWRLGTSVFLHAGIMHVAFNLIALNQIGPAMEKVFGRDRFLLYFVLMGVFASFASSFFLKGVGIGASGAILGLIGLGVGWAQRQGTTLARQFRNHLLQWFAYTMLFGLVANVDNVAHFAGFAAGGLLGYFTPVASQSRHQGNSLVILGTLSALAMIGFFIYKILTPIPYEELDRYLFELAMKGRF